MGDIGIGVGAEHTDYEWAVMHFDGGVCGRVDELDVSNESPLELEKASLQMRASIEGWTELAQATASAISDAVNRSVLTIEGDLPLFIRFADAFVLLVGCIGDACAARVAGAAPEQSS